MTPEIYEKLEAAVKSGKYTWGEGMLRGADGMCFLGMACDVLAPDGWDMHEEEGYEHWEHDGFGYMPSAEMRKKLGLNNLQAKRISRMSDHRVSWSTILKWIKKNCVEAG